MPQEQLEKRPFELKGVYVAAVVQDGTAVKRFRVLKNIWVNIHRGTWDRVNKAAAEFCKGARIDLKGVQIGGEPNKLETGWLGANAIFLHDGLVAGKKRRPVEREE